LQQEATGGLRTAYDDIAANGNMLKVGNDFTQSIWSTRGKPRAWYYIRTDGRESNVVDLTEDAEEYSTPSYFVIPDVYINYNS
jgi:hypothetical protein